MLNRGKDDTGKIMWDRLPFESLDKIAEVLTYGALKYNEDRYNPNWKTVDDPLPRYFAATMRHLSLWKQGQRLDSESGISHLAHAAANLLFLISFDEKIQHEKEMEFDMATSLLNRKSFSERMQSAVEEKDGPEKDREVNSEV